MKAFILSHSAVLDAGYVQQILNNTQSVQTWVAPFPYSAIVLSRLTVTELSAVLHSHFGEAWFILVEANKDNSNGWLPKDFWDYVGQPEVVWSRRLFANLALPNVPPPPPTNTFPNK